MRKYLSALILTAINNIIVNVKYVCFFLQDSISPSNVPSEKTHSYSYHDNQLEMSSVLAQHGMCFYAKEIASLESNMGSPNTLDLASKMLYSSSSSVALGKLASQDRRIVDTSSTKMTKIPNLLTRYEIFIVIGVLFCYYYFIYLFCYFLWEAANQTHAFTIYLRV